MCFGFRSKSEDVLCHARLPAALSATPPPRLGCVLVVYAGGGAWPGVCWCGVWPGVCWCAGVVCGVVRVVCVVWSGSIHIYNISTIKNKLHIIVIQR